MPVEFKDIAESLAAEGLLVPNLNVLEPDAKPYEVFIIQPVGPLLFRDDFVGSQNRDLAIKKFTAFLRDAMAKNVDLALSPEYSCPWESFEGALKSGLFPNSGKLWALGCESITPAALAALKARVPEVIWIHETPAAGPGRFLDPVCYAIKTETATGESKNVVVVQFKTIPMGGGETFERDHMICGQKQYFLRNRAQDYVRFYTIICSEALEFEIDNARALEFCQHPSIIFHPQMIEDARHPGIRKYRADLFRSTCSEHVEVICLNWAREMKAVHGEPQPKVVPIKGRSAIFMKSSKFDRTDNTIKDNHTLGAYYCRWNEHQTDICIFNYEEFVFRYLNQKVFLIGAAVQMRRTGPAIREVKKWNTGDQSWQVIAKADDGFEKLCESYKTPKLGPCLVDHSTPVDRERLLTLSAGTLDPDADWHRVEKMPSFIGEADERSKRLTFVQETSQASRDFRNDHLSRFIKLQVSVLANKAKFPPNIIDLAEDYKIVFPDSKNQFRFNLMNQADTLGAAVIFIGAKPQAEAKAFFNQLRSGWGVKDKKMREELTRRIVVAYEAPDGSIQMEHPGLGSYSDDSELPSSILSTKEP